MLVVSNALFNTSMFTRTGIQWRSQGDIQVEAVYGEGVGVAGPGRGLVVVDPWACPHGNCVYLEHLYTSKNSPINNVLLLLNPLVINLIKHDNVQ